MADTQVAVSSAGDAKARALAIIEANRECISFVRPEDLETSPLFAPVVTVIKPSKDDFYDPIPSVGIMAKPPLVNLMAEKAGVTILRTDTDKRDEYVYTAHAYGEKRQPDGTMRKGDASYEFDAEKRAELDAINQPNKYGTAATKRKHLLELVKFGEQRAVTGAQHALIHKLAHVNRSFKTAEELMRGMILLRIDLNTQAMLGSPGMRQAAIAHALGAQTELFGPRYDDAPAVVRTVTPEAEPADSFADLDPAASESTSEPETTTEPTPIEIARGKLEEWLASDVIKHHRRKPGLKTAAELITAMLADKGASLEALQDMIKRCSDLEARRVGGAA